MGFWKDDLERDGYITVYHGTHVRNTESVEKNGINRKDPRTGMISVAIGPHGLRVAHAYAGMSSSGGEHLFRQPGANPQHVPHKHRVVFAFRLPKERVMKHMDPDLGGNSPELKQKFVDRNAGDFLPTETPELRLREPIPPEFITAKYINRKLVEENMSQIQEFFKSPPPEQPPSGGEPKKKPTPPPRNFAPHFPTHDRPFLWNLGFRNGPQHEEDPEYPGINGGPSITHPNYEGHIRFDGHYISTNLREEEKEHNNVVAAVQHVVGGDLERVRPTKSPRRANNESDKTNESFLGFKEFIEALVEEGIPNNNASSGNVKNIDPVLPIGDKPVQRRTNILDIIREFLRNAKLRPSNRTIPPNDINNYDHPPSAARSAAIAGDGSVQGT